MAALHGAAQRVPDGRGIRTVNSVAETMRAARAKIEDPKHWIKGNYARVEKNNPIAVDVRDPRAQCWCAVGALMSVDGPYMVDAAVVLAEAIIGPPIFGPSYARDRIVTFNDAAGRRHRDVLRKFDEAIALAESRQ